ncbi:MAG: acylphosphatase [Planctomycetota bacterium]
MAGKPDGGRIRIRVIYSGRVQGVCFRANAHELSRDRDVVGWVRNRLDGTVELEAEGPADAVEAFLAAVARRFTSYIANAQRTSLPPRSAEAEFEIRF